MIIKIYKTKNEYNTTDSFELSVNEQYQFSVGNGLNECPEDATLQRDLSFVFRIPNLMEQAYEAGKRGEELDIIEHIVKNKEDEED
jgi:hypothetical protein